MGDIAHEVASKVAGLAPEPLPSHLIDAAKVILAANPAMTNATRAQAWDIYHRTATLADFERDIQTVTLPPETKKALLQAKRETFIPQAAKPVARAIQALKSIPADALQLAESHPTVAKSLIDAATKSGK